jgi:multidrug efflux pump
VTSISISLIAVFMPILLMGGIVGRLFREFAMTLSLAILVSLAISLTTTPMMCAIFLKSGMHRPVAKRKTFFDHMLSWYERSLAWALRHGAIVMLILLITIGLNVVLYVIVPKGFFPQQDTGRLMGQIQADQSISFQAMQTKLTQLMSIVQHDPAVATVVGFTGAGGGGGAGSTNTGSVFVALKSISDRPDIDTVMARLRRELSVVPGARLFLVPIQDLRVGGRQSSAAYQYTLQGDSTAQLYEWAPKLVTALEHDQVLADVNSDQQQKGLETDLVIDRGTASRLGINASQVDNTLYDAFGQRQVSTIYSAQNQYHVIMEVEPRYWQAPQTLKDIYVSTAGGSASGSETNNAVIGTVTAGTTSSSRSSTSASGSSSTSSAASSSTVSAASIASSSARNAATNSLANTGKGTASSAPSVSTSVETMIPLAAFTKYGPGNTPLAVNHQGSFVATTISFNLAPGKSLSDATDSVEDAMRRIGMPASIHGSFAGTAQTFQQSLNSEPILILSALIAVYIVLGVLYESYIHPITIISTLPSAGVGAVLALLIFNIEFSIIALIGVILLIGIVKKNAILMIDFALEAERSRDMEPRDAIFEACRLRFRPIMMTTSAAILGAMPLAVSFGNGGELRRPLGISIVGGLLLSQVLTLYTTPVLYLYLDRFRVWTKRLFRRAFPGLATRPRPAE